MAEKDNPFGNFSIDNAEMNSGNQELLTSFLDDTAPEEIVPITSKETTKKPEEKKKAPIVKKDEEEDLTKRSIEELDIHEEEEEEEEPLKKPVKKDEESEEEEEEEDPKKASTFAVISKELFNHGIFTKDEEEEDVEINTPEDFLERFNYEKKKGAQIMVENYISRFGPDYQQAFQAIFENGVPPREYLASYTKIENLAEIDLTQEANQIAVIKQGLAEQGYEEDDITTELERLKNYQDLEKVAKTHHKVLVKKEGDKLVKLEEESQNKQRQLAASRQQYIKNVQAVLQEKLKTKDFDGIPVNQGLLAETQNFLLQEKYKTPAGETLTDFDKFVLDLKRPENHVLKVKVGLLFKILEKDPTLSTIKKAGLTQKSNGLFEELARKTSKSSNKSEKSSSRSFNNL